jgi:preprotein translocase subunit SecG
LLATLNAAIILGRVMILLILIQRARAGACGAFGAAGGSAPSARGPRPVHAITLITALIWVLLIMPCQDGFRRSAHLRTAVPVIQPEVRLLLPDDGVTGPRS